MTTTMMTTREHATMQKRLTWTEFHLPSTQPWPTWPDAAVPGDTQYSDPYFGPLRNVPGVENVRLGRRVENVEQAAFIILWNSVDALIAFQTSPLCSTFLETLDVYRTASAETTSAPSARLASLQWDHGFDLDTELNGRITLDKFTGLGTWASWHEGWRNAFVGFVPLGCRDWNRMRPPMNRLCITWLDKQGGEQQGGMDAVHSDKQQGDERVRERWEFLRWNDPSYDATREREEESTKQPGAREHWEAAVRRYMPPVQTWQQERWDVDTPHQSPNYPLENFDDNEEEEAEEGEGLDYEIEEDDSLPVSIR